MDANTVLFVDDEANILKALKRLLRNEPYQVLTATCAEEALDQFRRSEIQVVVSDQRMPEMSGADFLSCLRERARHLDYFGVLPLMCPSHVPCERSRRSVNSRCGFDSLGWFRRVEICQ